MTSIQIVPVPSGCCLDDCCESCCCCICWDKICFALLFALMYLILLTLLVLYILRFTRALSIFQFGRSIADENLFQYNKTKIFNKYYDSIILSSLLASG